MNNNSTIQLSNIPSNKKMDPDGINESFFSYVFEISADIVLGLVLGLFVNIVADFIGKIFGINIIGILIIQFILICLVLYILKVDSKYLYKSWKGKTSYGIVFTVVFFAVQKNVVKFFDYVISEERKNKGLWRY